MCGDWRALQIEIQKVINDQLPMAPLLNNIDTIITSLEEKTGLIRPYDSKTKGTCMGVCVCMCVCVCVCDFLYHQSDTDISHLPCSLLPHSQSSPSSAATSTHGLVVSLEARIQALESHVALLIAAKRNDPSQTAQTNEVRSAFVCV